MRLRDKKIGPRILVVTAVDAECAAVLSGLDLDKRPAEVALAAGQQIVVQAGGVGQAASAAATATLITTAQFTDDPFDLVVSAGIAGGFGARCGLGATVLGTRSVAVDLGADSADGFIGLDALGFGRGSVNVDPRALLSLRGGLPDAVVGEILSVNTVTGTAARAAALLNRHPDAVAEAMEGFGVACAADAAGTPFAELRTISNPVGPRDRAAWRIDDALDALRLAVGALATLVW